MYIIAYLEFNSLHFFLTMVIVNESYSVCCLETDGVLCDALLFILPVTRTESVCHRCIVAVAVKTLITSEKLICGNHKV